MQHSDPVARIQSINRKYIVGNVLLVLVAVLLIAGFAWAGR